MSLEGPSPLGQILELEGPHSNKTVAKVLANPKSEIILRDSITRPSPNVKR